MNKFLILFVLCFATHAKTQILDQYPKNQDFYEGGITNFYKEANEYLVKTNFKGCDKNEIYQPRIIVTKEKTIKLIQDFDAENVTKNKCAYDLSMELIKNLKNWKPAVVKGMTFGAITEFIIYPDDLLGNYKTGYNAEQFVLEAQYPKGYEAFGKEFNANFKALFMDYHINGETNLEFYVNKEGHIVNARIYPAIDNMDFNKDFMRALGRLKKVWKPAQYSNIPIKQRIAFPVSFNINFTENRTR